MKSFLNQIAVISRGLRNNNPGNLRLTSIGWEGKVPNVQNTDGAFEQFQALPWGIRALAIDIRTKIRKGLDTIDKIIRVYAPHTENDTHAYITRVVRLTGIAQHQKLTADKATIKKIIAAIIKVENRADEAHLIKDKDLEDGLALVESTFDKVVATGGSFFFDTDGGRSDLVDGEKELNQEEDIKPAEKEPKENSIISTNKIMIKWKAVIIDIGIDALMDVIKKSGKVKKFAEFLFSEKMQNTLAEVYQSYTLALKEWEEDEESS
ncbi:structural protein [Flexithrix dorotheae]|uniref:structural protein n=1 Tax=Flexithrix dorotheae TaxID=70993 RepID=UPI0003A502D2|nr:structural protein [Flexithrix dorotheae]